MWVGYFLFFPTRNSLMKTKGSHITHNLRLSSTPLKSIDYMPFRLVVYAQFYNSKMNFS